MGTRTLVVAAVALLAVAGVPAHAPAHARAEAGRDVAYRPPVDGRVLRAFDAPRAPWGSGHRGVDLAAAPGEQVLVAAPGRVTFAGSVAGSAWVTVAHRDGVRTSYGPLTALVVAPGHDLAAGSPLGEAAAGHGPVSAGRHALHWSARRAGAYIDPLTLLDNDRWRPALLAPGDNVTADEPDVPSYAPWPGRRPGVLGAVGLVAGSPVASAPGWALPPNPNHVIGVAGLGSDSTRVPMDLTHLGYEAQQTTYLGYAGRSDLGPPDPRDPRRDQLPYGPADTWRGVDEAAAHLEEQLRAHHVARPGEAVDLVGHSMGGVVVLHYLLDRHDPSDPGLPPIGHVVTIASPLEGADLASAVRSAAGRSRAVDGFLNGLGMLIGQPAPDAAAIEDLAVGSVIVERIRHGWADAREDRWSSPLATGTQVLTLGGSRDVVVPERRSDLPGGDHVVLPGGHDRVRLTEASRQVVRAFLADRPVPGEPGGLGHVLSYPLGWGERLVGWGFGVLP